MKKEINPYTTRAGMDVELLGKRVFHYESQYLKRMWRLFLQGELLPERVKADRTGVGRHSILGGYLTHDTLSYGPAFMISKGLFVKGVLEELAWLLRGETNIQSLVDAGVHIWDSWADEHGELGPVYGAQWRLAGGRTDQVRNLLEALRKNPTDSGAIVDCWQVADLPRMALRPCHTLWQVCIQDGRLDLMLYQRSADWLLGVPFNAASYTTLQCLLAHLLNVQPGVFHHYFGDTHLYADQLEAAEEQILRVPDLMDRLLSHDSGLGTPRMHVPGINPLDLSQPVPSEILLDVSASNFVLEGYSPEPPLKTKVKAAV